MYDIFKILKIKEKKSNLNITFTGKGYFLNDSVVGKGWANTDDGIALISNVSYPFCKKKKNIKYWHSIRYLNNV